MAYRAAFMSPLRLAVHWATCSISNPRHRRHQGERIDGDVFPVSPQLSFLTPQPLHRSEPRRLVLRQERLDDFAEGFAATVAAEVWMRPCASVSGTRYTRCTPLSNLRRAKTSAPLISALPSLRPPSPVSERARIALRT